MFEVDFPATQAWKRTRLAGAGIPIPNSLTFVPVNFETQDLSEQLVRESFDPSRPAFFSWLGVTMYLTPDVVMATLGLLPKWLPPGSGIASVSSATWPWPKPERSRPEFDEFVAQKRRRDPAEMFTSTFYRAYASAGH